MDGLTILKVIRAKAMESGLIHEDLLVGQVEDAQIEGQIRDKEEEKKAGEIVAEMLAQQEIRPDDSGVKEVIERVTEYDQLFQCALCLSLVYDPY